MKIILATDGRESVSKRRARPPKIPSKSTRRLLESWPTLQADEAVGRLDVLSFLFAVQLTVEEDFRQI
jgi:hypothetical protein